MYGGALRGQAWRALAGAFCLFAGVTASAAESIDRAAFIRLAASLVKVEASNDSGHYSLGTAVTIAPGRVVTNCHVTRDARRIAIVRGTERLVAVAQYSDLMHDLCLLDVPKLQAEPVRLGRAGGLRIGQKVGAMGYTGGIDMGFREGSVIALHSYDGSKVIQTSTAFTSGASGGALFDVDGRLVGILTFRLPGPNTTYFSAPVDWIAGHADGADDFRQIAPLEPIKSFWQLPPQNLPYFMRAALLEAGGKWEQLLTLAEDWAAFDGRNPEPWIARGRAFQRLDRLDAALKSFDRATQAGPDSSEAWFNLGVACFKLGEAEELQRAYATLSRLNPDLADDLAVIAGLSRQ